MPLPGMEPGPADAAQLRPTRPEGGVHGGEVPRGPKLGGERAQGWWSQAWPSACGLLLRRAAMAEQAAESALDLGASAASAAGTANNFGNSAALASTKDLETTVKEGMSLIDRFYNGGNRARPAALDILVVVLDISSLFISPRLGGGGECGPGRRVRRDAVYSNSCM